MREVELGGGERLESLDVGGLHIISSPGLYAYTADSVKLGMSAKCRAGDAVVDLGTGGGILPLLIYGYFRPQKIVGVEIRENAAKLAEKSVYLNELEDKIAILNIPIQQAAEVLGRGAFDVAVSNPPYYKVQKEGFISENEDAALSKFEVAVTLSEVVAAAAALIKRGGAFYLSVKPERMAEACALLENAQMAVKEIKLYSPPNKDKIAFSIIKAVKGAAEGSEVFLVRL